MRVLSCVAIGFFFLLSISSVQAADGSMRQLKSDGHYWEGPIANLHRTGLHEWAGMWNNNRGEHHDVTITLKDGNKVDIFEQQPEQHWVGPYEIASGVYYATGKEAKDDSLTFSAILPLAQ